MMAWRFQSSRSSNLFRRSQQIKNSILHFKIVKFSAIFVLLLAIHFSLRSILQKILLPKQGIDLSDEGFYLLSSSPSNNYAAYSWPWGWFTAKMYSLSGTNISELRILSAEILLVLTFSVSYCILERIDRQKPRLRLSTTIYSMLLALSSLYFYAGMLRSPSYNYINFISIQLSIIGILAIENPQKRIRLSGFSIFSAGIILAMSAKPSTALLYLTIFIIFKRQVEALILVITTVFLEISLLVLFQIWPINFYEQFFRALKAPALLDRQSPAGALFELSLTPFNIFKPFTLLTILLMTLLTILPFKNQLTKGSGVLVSLSGLVIVFEYLRNVYSSEILGFANVRIAVFWAHVSLIVFVLSRITSRNFLDKRIITLIVVAIVAFGFGSSNAILPMSQLVLFYFILFSVFLVLQIHSRQIGYFLLIILFGISSVGISEAIVDGHEFPYRSPTLTSMKSKVQIAQTKQHIFLDKETAQEILKLQKAAYASGFTPKTRLVNLVWPWKPGISYLLGGTHPQSVIFSIFGSQYTFESARYWIDEVEPVATFDSYWILVSQKELIPARDERIFSDLIKLINTKSRLRYPDDFELVIRTGTYELWKPSHT